MVLRESADRPVVDWASCDDAGRGGGRTRVGQLVGRDSHHRRGPRHRRRQPIVPNGLPLSKIHHAAFDANLIGIDPDFRVHISDALLSMNDGPLFEHGIKGMSGRIIRLPKRSLDYPDRDRLAERFECFMAR
jgi:predicted restriction endonuclease